MVRLLLGQLPILSLWACVPSSVPVFDLGGGKHLYINILNNASLHAFPLIPATILLLLLLVGVIFQTLYIRRLHRKIRTFQDKDFSDSLPVESAPQQLPEASPSLESDEEFMETVRTIAEEHIREAEWKIDHFASSLCMSRTVFYSRMKQLTGHTPLEYLREVRLLRAKALLEGGGVSVTTVAFETGFSDPKYFSKCFKKRFGYLPSKLCS